MHSRQYRSWKFLVCKAGGQFVKQPVQTRKVDSQAPMLYYQKTTNLIRKVFLTPTGETFSNFYATHENENWLELEQKKNCDLILALSWPFFIGF